MKIFMLPSLLVGLTGWRSLIYTLQMWILPKRYKNQCCFLHDPLYFYQNPITSFFGKVYKNYPFLAGQPSSAQNYMPLALEGIGIVLPGVSERYYCRHGFFLV